MTAAKLLKRSEEKLAEAIAEKVESGVLIDLGSGTGYLSIEIAKRSPRLRVYGIDLSRKMVEIARRHAEGVWNVRFWFGDAANLPFGDDSVDSIVSTGSLHHWRNLGKVLDQCHRVLRNGKEAWIYDGCSDALRKDTARVRKEYGSFTYRLLTKVTELHGFSEQEYGSIIKPIIDQSKFRDSYQMEPEDFWMKITLKKNI